ncbi:MAG: ribonuclease Z [Candidatus Omnitrophica bacterium]|nr:ribonuclease Z [Candidatus Omnitrophota bacterium]
MKAIFLGTNGWYNTDTGNTTCILVQARDAHIVFDAGDGFYKLDRYIKDSKPIHLFISHIHLDHITGLHTINKFNFSQGIKIYGTKETLELILELIRPPYSIELGKLPFKVEFVEIVEGTYDFGFGLEARKLFHSVECLGYRIQADAKTVSYCTDTGICDNAAVLSKNADLSMFECALKSGQDDKAWPHLTPHAAANIAKAAGAKKMALIHFNPFLYPAMDDRITAEKEAKEIFPGAFYTRDGLEVSV